MTTTEAHRAVRCIRAKLISELQTVDLALQVWTERLIVAAYLHDRCIGDVAELAMRQALSAESL